MGLIFWKRRTVNGICCNINAGGSVVVRWCNRTFHYLEIHSMDHKALMWTRIFRSYSLFPCFVNVGVTIINLMFLKMTVERLHLLEITPQSFSGPGMSFWSFWCSNPTVRSAVSIAEVGLGGKWGKTNVLMIRKKEISWTWGQHGLEIGFFLNFWF